MSNSVEPSRSLPDFAHEMKRDWDDRARENAKWYINTIKREQSDEEFDETGRPDVEKQVLADLDVLTRGRDPGALKLLEIGCGIGRMTCHLARIFGEVHATDVSGEMVGQARRRFAALPNAHFHETSGYDFAALPGDYFDIAFSIYVFQHVPDLEVIRANIRDTLRVLKPGGIFKFQASGITSAAYDKMEKNTWTGASFPEAESRRLSAEIGAQLVRLSGAGTQYFWTTLRKPRPQSAGDASPRIIFFGRADDPQVKSVPTRGDYAYLTLIIEGLDRETADCNTVSVEIAGREVWPCYVGPPGGNYAAALPGRGHELTQVNLAVPAEAPLGPAEVRLRLASDAAAEPVTVELEPAPPAPPRINLVANDLDGGVDVYARGPKSLVRLFVEGLGDDLDPGRVRVRIGGRDLAPLSIEFIPANAVHLVKVQLPADTAPGETQIQLSADQLHPASATIKAL